MTLEIVRRDGSSALTIERVAAEAGVGRPTVYRRWPSKAHLLLDAMSRALGGLRPGVSTGDTKRDLLAGVSTLFRAFEGELGGVMPAFVAELSAHPDLADQFRRRVLGPRRESMAQLIRDGIRLGEIRSDTDVELVLDLLAAPLYYRAIFGHAAQSATATRRIVDTIWRGIAAHEAPPRARR